MTLNLNLPSIQKSKDYIYAIDFSMIIDKMVKHQHWKRSDAEKVCEYYRNFLYLNKKYGANGVFPPSEEIDEMWHNHILDTIKYRKDCEEIFGKYFDHYPYFGIDGKSDMNDLNNAFENLQQIHQNEFGHRITRIRKITVKEFFSTITKAIIETYRKK